MVVPYFVDLSNYTTQHNTFIESSTYGIKMSFAAERERRQTAGNRLKRLLEQQEDPDDEFYGTAYGGFVDVRIVTFVLMMIRAYV